MRSPLVSRQRSRSLAGTTSPFERGSEPAALEIEFGEQSGEGLRRDFMVLAVNDELQAQAPLLPDFPG